MRNFFAKNLLGFSKLDFVKKKHTSIDFGTKKIEKIWVKRFFLVLFSA